VSAITFIDMRELMWHSMVISPAERESAYVIDGIMRNEVVKSDIHSTETHGYSEAIFGATFGLVEFAPRIKGVGNQQLYAFQKRKHYEELGYKLLPDRYIQSAAGSRPIAPRSRPPANTNGSPIRSTATRCCTPCATVRPPPTGISTCKGSSISRRSARSIQSVCSPQQIGRERRGRLGSRKFPNPLI
jgi:hypothetical protein